MKEKLVRHDNRGDNLQFSELSKLMVDLKSFLSTYDKPTLKSYFF